VLADPARTAPVQPALSGHHGGPTRHDARVTDAGGAVDTQALSILTVAFFVVLLLVPTFTAVDKIGP